MAITAKERSRTALRGTTALEPATVLAAVKRSTEQARGGGTGWITSGLSNVGAQVHVERETESQLWLSINSGKRIIELCTFTAAATADGDGRTRVRVGGLESYKTTQQKAFGFVPVAPKAIHGVDLYKRFLDAVHAELLAQDPTASITIGIPA
jgi:hypothetical protein